MPAFIRYPIFGCIILSLSACGGSGSSRLLGGGNDQDGDNGNGTDSIPEMVYQDVDYLIKDGEEDDAGEAIKAAIDKFPGTGESKQVYQDERGRKYLLTSQNVADMDLTNVKLPAGVTTAPAFDTLFAVYEDKDGNKYLLTPDNVMNMNLTDATRLPTGVALNDAPDFADLTVSEQVSTGATALTSSPANLDLIRSGIIRSSNRYLSTGAVLARTDDGGIMTERPNANCADGTPGYATCAFAMDTLREATTFHLGPASSSGENQVSLRSFMADREPVMFYRDTFLSQVRTSNLESLLNVYADEAGNRYLLTSKNVTDMDLTGVALPTGVMTLPDFDELLPVYKDDDGNEYRLTAANITNMNLDSVDLPEGVTEDTKPMFDELTKDTERDNDGYEYVGYDGMLEYSMFFVGVYRFFDDDDELQHMRFENASLGRIYDEDAIESGIQSPSVALTGEGVMVGMEREISSLESHLVQGDVNIMYSPFDAGADPTDMADDVQAMINIRITNIQRLADDGDAWYGDDNSRASLLNWPKVGVIGSKFEDNTPGTGPTDRKLLGSFYGTEDDPEVGGVFYHKDFELYEIIGSFGSKLDPVPGDDDPDMMNP